jgi:hypothetical protein
MKEVSSTYGEIIAEGNPENLIRKDRNLGGGIAKEIRNWGYNRQ